MTSQTPNNQEPVWPLPAVRAKVFALRINRNILLTLIISVLLHLSLLWLFAPKLFSIGAPQKEARPLEISLGPPQKKQTAPSEPVLPDLRPLPQPPTTPKPVKLPKVKKVKPVKKPAPKKLPVEVVKESETKVVKQEKVNKKPPKPVPQDISPNPLPGEDMQAFIRRQKEARLAKRGLSKQDVEEVLASSNPQSDGDRRDAKIRENLNLDGTNGIFSIRDLSVHTAQFSFKGRKTNINTARLEIINVRAPSGLDIKLAVIRRMIEIIRREYDGNFKWDSRRLNRVIELSARREDTKALEDFLMREFFGPHGAYR